MLSLNPDEYMKWIYDKNHPRYHSDEAECLRNSRQNALNICPPWMIEEARMNDLMKKCRIICFNE